MDSPLLHAVFHVQQQKEKTLFANVIIGIFGMGGVFHTHSYLLSTHTPPHTFRQGCVLVSSWHVPTKLLTYRLGLQLHPSLWFPLVVSGAGGDCCVAFVALLCNGQISAWIWGTRSLSESSHSRRHSCLLWRFAFFIASNFRLSASGCVLHIRTVSHFVLSDFNLAQFRLCTC